MSSEQYVEKIKMFYRYECYMEDIDKRIALYMICVEQSSVAGLIRSLLSDIALLEAKLNRQGEEDATTEA